MFTVLGAGGGGELTLPRVTWPSGEGADRLRSPLRVFPVRWTLFVLNRGNILRERCEEKGKRIENEKNIQAARIQKLVFGRVDEKRCFEPTMENAANKIPPRERIKYTCFCRKNIEQCV